MISNAGQTKHGMCESHYKDVRKESCSQSEVMELPWNGRGK